MDLLLAQFHFIRPWWFLALAPTLILALLLHRHKQQSGQWLSYLPAHLAAVLVDQGDRQHKTRLALFLALAWLLVIVALAGPSWQKIERPLFKVKQAHVVILDMSLSMYATDMAPNRLTRAKYKVSDLIKQLGEGETALIAYAGEAFVISPMTSDVANLLNLLPALNPSIMPALGSRPDLAIEKALELLKQTQYSAGQIYLVADDMSATQARLIRQQLSNTKFDLNIMAVGTAQGAPIKLPNEQLLKDQNGNIVIPSMPAAILAGLANNLSGNFAQISHSNADISTIVNSTLAAGEKTQVTDQFGDRWQEVGPYLLLLLLPLVAFSCRKGMLQSVIVVSLLMTSYIPTPLHAATAKPIVVNAQTNSWWQDLWQTGDQQGLKSFESDKHEQALTEFEDPRWRGASQYKLGQYQQALESFEKFNDSQSLYNQGNALTQLGQYEQAIDRYQHALTDASDSTSIEKNLNIAQQLLAQQQQQEKEQQGDESQPNDDDQHQGEQQDQDNKSEQQSQQAQQDQDKQQDQSANNESQEQPQSESDKQQTQDGKQTQDKPGEDKGEQEQSEQTPEQQRAAKEEQAKAAKLNENFNEDNLTKEQLAHLNQLMNKINDDPSLLLKNKMAIEARKRQRQRLVKKEAKNW